MHSRSWNEIRRWPLYAPSRVVKCSYSRLPSGRMKKRNDKQQQNLFPKFSTFFILFSSCFLSFFSFPGSESAPIRNGIVVKRAMIARCHFMWCPRWLRRADTSSGAAFGRRWIAVKVATSCLSSETETQLFPSHSDFVTAMLRLQLMMMKIWLDWLTDFGLLWNLTRVTNSWWFLLSFVQCVSFKFQFRLYWNSIVTFL